MHENNWYKVFPGAITVTDAEGAIIEMNDASADMFKKDGGYEIMGRNAITCHPPRTQEKVRKIYETQSKNIYSITKNGKKTGWFTRRLISWTENSAALLRSA